MALHQPQSVALSPTGAARGTLFCRRHPTSHCIHCRRQWASLMWDNKAMSDGVRLDQYLDYACLIKTRSQAKTAIELGRVQVNGQRVKPSHEVHAGDTIMLEQEYHQRIVKVVGVLDRHVAKAQARASYEDLTPQPSEEVMEQRKLDRRLKEMWTPTTKPDKGDRRKLRRIKGGG